MTRKTHYFPLSGGENLVDPPIKIKPGELIFSKNYEPGVNGGYRRIDGFERFDGLPSPSDASYFVLGFTAGGTEPVAGNTVTGATSGATGEVLTVVVDSGTWGGADAAGTVVLFNVTGTYQDAEALNISGSPVATADGPSYENGASTDANHEAWTQAAIEARRADISALPGSGPVRGVWGFGGDVYAFRDNAGGTECVMHKSTSAGWVAQDLGAELAFSAGTTAFAVGETVTGGTSGATGVIVAMVVTSGDWATNDAAGRLHLKTLSGTFQAETITSATGSATASGAQTANVLQPGGRFECVNYNFYGASDSVKMYAANGVNKAFQWDGSGFASIYTGMATDTPAHIAGHKRHLFLSFDSSVQHSSIGNPLEWSPITGASEIATGDTVTGIETLPNDALAILDRNHTYVLYGTSSADWNLTELSREAGAIEWTVQPMSGPLYLDDRGLTNITAVQTYGDFNAKSVSRKIKPLLDAKKQLAIASMRVRAKDQYRVFFSDNTGIVARVVGNSYEFTRIDYGMPVRCCCSSEDASGEELLFFGSDDGFVYQLDSGNSFDGTAIDASMRLAFHHYGSPQHKKRFYEIVAEVDAPLGATIYAQADFDYGSRFKAQGAINTFDVESGGAYWDDYSAWSEFIWDAQIVGTAEAHLDGSGVNMGLMIRSELAYSASHTITGIITHYGLRGLQR